MQISEKRFQNLILNLTLDDLGNHGGYLNAT